jgi:hypothetical protein
MCKGACSCHWADGQRITIPVTEIEFVIGENMVWIHGPGGTNILRIGTNGRINIITAEGAGALTDVRVNHDIDVCLPQEIEETSHVH